MSTGKIGLISYWAPPQGAIAAHRIVRLSRCLQAAGHEVHWITLDAARLDKTDPALAKMVPAGIVRHGISGSDIVARGAAQGFWQKVGVTAIEWVRRHTVIRDGHLAWALRLRRRLPEIVRKAGLDVVMASCGPHSSLLALPRLRARAPSVRIFADYRDLLNGNAWNDSDDEGRRAKLLAHEREALAAVDGLFVNTEHARDRFLKVVRPRDGFPVEVMRNAADYELADEILADIAVPDLGDGIHVGYFGTVFPRRRLAPVIESIARLPADVRGRFRFHLYSSVESIALAEEDCHAAGIEPDSLLVRHGFVEYGQALAAMRAMDALVLVNGPTLDDRIFVPGKLFDYLMARRPILFVGEPGDASRIVGDCCGSQWCLRHTDPDGIDAALNRLAQQRLPDEAPHDSYAPNAAFAPLLEKMKQTQTAS